MMDVFLVHGPDPVEIQSERIRIVDSLLPIEQRDENLTEFNPPGNRPLTLQRLLPELMAELGTVSFFPGAKRVALVNDLSDFFAPNPKKTAKKVVKKATKTKAGVKSKPALEPAERLIRYLEGDFQSTENALVFTVYEDPDKRRVVDKRRKLAQWIGQNGRLKSFEGPQPIAFRLGDAIAARNLPLALALFREGYRKGRTDHLLSLFHTILRQVRFLLQAKIVASAQQKVSESFISEELLPDDKKSSLLQMHPFPRGKFIKASHYFSIAELTEALTDLYEINRHIIPSQNDVYVADAGYLMERLLIRLCSKTS